MRPRSRVRDVEQFEIGAMLKSLVSSPREGFREIENQISIALGNACKHCGVPSSV